MYTNEKINTYVLKNRHSCNIFEYQMLFTLENLLKKT